MQRAFLGFGGVFERRMWDGERREGGGGGGRGSQGGRLDVGDWGRQGQGVIVGFGGIVDIVYHRIDDAFQEHWNQHEGDASVY